MDPTQQHAARFGKYQLLNRLAVGGMAELFVARDSTTHERVVIKRILPYLAREEGFVQMFLDEARIASQLHHPNIIQIHELGNLEGSIFIAMEYVEGADLRRLLQEELKAGRVMPYNLAAFVVSKVCAGLFYAHNRVGRDGKAMEIVHRDISPQNVMLGFDGAVKLVDFGIAKAGALMHQTKPGIIKGKFFYLAPEQLTQERTDHRADLFSLGAMLYELTTGKTPFERSGNEAVIYAIRTEEPVPPHQLRPDYPKALSQIVLRCLVKDRSRRYQSAAEIQQDLERYLRTVPTTDAPAVGRFVTALTGSEADEATMLAVPEMLAEARAAIAAGALATASSTENPEVRRSDSQASKPFAQFEGSSAEPRTLMARPADLSEDTQAPPSPLSPPPARKPSGPDYARAGEAENTETGEGPPGAPALRPSSPPRPTAQAPSLSPEARTVHARPARPSHEDFPIPPARQAKPRASRSNLADAWKSPVVLAVVAFCVIALGGLFYRHFNPRPPARTTDEGVAQHTTTSPALPSLKEDVAVVPRPQGEPPRLPEHERDAGPAAVPVPESAVAQTKPEATPPKPESRVAASEAKPRLGKVTFKAPGGTRIVHGGRRLSPGKSYAFPFGTLKVRVLCPARPGKKGFEMNVTLKVGAGSQTERLCKGR